MTVTPHISSSPHFTDGCSTQKIMALVLLSLIPECVMAVLTFGLEAFILLITSVTSCMLFEYLFQKCCKQKITVSNLSSAVTGVMLALVVSSKVPIWMIVIGSFVAIVIAKGLFGGIGSNIFNPALTGRGFMFLSFGSAMSRWAVPHTDAVSSATVLSQIKNSTHIQNGLLENFIGNTQGCMGETSALLILISFIFLLLTKVIDWRAPVTMIATVFILTFSASLSIYDATFAVLTGGIMFGAVFMVTDYATTPVTKKGRLIFGFGCGLITFLIRRFGGYPEGVMFSILIMNSIAPFLNRLTERKYGYQKGGV